jgi:hypothetical protein
VTYVLQLNRPFESMEQKFACVVCWNQSESISIDISESGDCTRCRQQFKPITLERLDSLSPWRAKAAQVRPRPTGHDHEFELCSFFRKGRCALGSKCSFAHSEEEKETWNRELLAEQYHKVRPRPKTGLDRYIMCKAFEKGSCMYGDKCTYAHSQLERRVWNECSREPGSPFSSGSSTSNGSRTTPLTKVAEAVPGVSRTPEGRPPRTPAPPPAAGKPALPGAAPESVQFSPRVGNIFSAARQLHSRSLNSPSPAIAEALQNMPGAQASTSARRAEAPTPPAAWACPPAQTGWTSGAAIRMAQARYNAEQGTRSDSAGTENKEGGGSAWGGAGQVQSKGVPDVGVPAPQSSLFQALEEGGGNGAAASELLRCKGGIEIEEERGYPLEVVLSADELLPPERADSGGAVSASVDGLRAEWRFVIRNGGARATQTLVSVCTLERSRERRLFRYCP